VRPVPAAVLLSGCIPQGGFDLGPALAGIYLGTDTDVEALVTLRAGVWVALLTEVRLDGAPADLPIRDGRVDVLVDGEVARLTPLPSGPYVTAPVDVPRMLTRPDHFGWLLADAGAGPIAMGAAMPPVLKLGLELDPHPAGEDLEVPLPDGWTDDYDYVLAELVGPEGVVWTDYPAGVGGWLGWLADPPQPDSIVIPSEALEGGPVAALGVHFLQQLDRRALFAGPVNEPVSTLVGGTAWLVPLTVLP
jgi:hypothetical protein